MVAADSTRTGYNIIAKGLQHVDGSNASEGRQQGGQSAAETAGQLEDDNDLVMALKAVLSVSVALVNGGSWWREAKAQCPLLLIERLHHLSRVGGAQGGCQSCFSVVKMEGTSSSAFKQGGTAALRITAICACDHEQPVRT
jgi:hypothetical protein